MPDDFIFSKNAEIIFSTLDKFGILRNILDLVFPIYGKVCGFNPRDFRIYAIGQSHLDTAWNWTWAWTKKKIRKTFGNNLKRLEKYPHYKFSASAPVHYEYFEQAYPTLFTQLKQYVAENRWDIVGGMYCEPDGNVPDGESLVRQRLYGQKYYLKTFGKRSLVAWVPDSFGFTWTYPQIFVKSGSPYFYTTKLTWNLEHEFPFSTFWWEGVDGSRVLAVNCRNGFRGLESIGDFAKKARLLPKKTKNDIIYNYSTDFDSNDQRTDVFVGDYPHVYGFGDGGAGPLLAELLIPEVYRRSRGWQFVKAATYFKLLERDYGDRIPIWRDELYLEVHRGCQTTLYRAKKKNRKGEVELPKLEKFLVAINLLKQEDRVNNLIYPDFPIDIIDHCWKKLLFNQFHDILPGSSIEEVYNDADKDYDFIFKNIEKIKADHIKKIKESMNLAEQPHAVFFHANVWDGDVVYFEENGLDEKTSIKIIEKPRGIGFQQIHGNYFQEQTKNLPEVAEKDDIITFSTTYIQGKISTDTGSIVSLKTSQDNFQRDFASWDSANAKFGLNKLKIFIDEPDSNDAWNLDKDYRQKEIKSVDVSGYEILKADIQNPILEICCNMKIHESSAILRYIIHPKLPYIIIKLHLDYQEHRKLLRTEFDTTLNADVITTSLAYGFISRPTVPTQPLEMGRWEFPGQKFISLSDGNVGLSVLCENRYGFDSRGQSFGMSLKKAPLYGNADDFMNVDPDTKNQKLHQIAAIPKEKRKEIKDLGEHDILWAIYPHKGDYKTAEVYETFFNLTDSPIKIDNFNLVESNNFIQFLDCDSPGVRISAIKPIYGAKSGLVIRLFEFHGEKVNCKLSFHQKLNSSLKKAEIFEGDLLEGKDFVESKQLLYDEASSSIETELTPYEIKTIVIKQ